MSDLQLMPIMLIKHITKKIFAGKNIETILDCSFGTGCLTFCLSELGYHVSGSDLNEKMLRRAQDKAVQMGLDIDFVQCDFREFSSHFNQMFDCVMSTGNALAHVTADEIRMTLREMDRLVRPGGYIYFDSRNWDKKLKEKKHFRWGNPFSISFVCTVLNEMGYKNLMIKPCPWFDDKPFEEVEWYCLMAEKPQSTEVY